MPSVQNMSWSLVGHTPIWKPIHWKKWNKNSFDTWFIIPIYREKFYCGFFKASLMCFPTFSVVALFWLINYHPENFAINLYFEIHMQQPLWLLEYIYIYIYIYKHTHTHTYVYIYIYMSSIFCLNIFMIFQDIMFFIQKWNVTLKSCYKN